MTSQPRELTLGDLARSLGGLVTGLEGDPSTVIRGIAYDSRAVGDEDLFCCIPGIVTDGHQYAPEAIEAGAVALCTTRSLTLGVPELVVSDARSALARASAEAFGHPADKLRMIGITGTNGKTTSAYLLKSILEAAGEAPGLIGTVETHVGEERRPGVRTTPESLDLQRLLSEMVDAGARSVAMEVTSHALVLRRIEGIRFRAAGFTNLSQDHLDFHAGMDDYFEAKRSLFTPELSDGGAINIDDVYGRKLVETATIPCLTFGINTDADVRAGDIVLQPSVSSFVIESPKGRIDVETSLVGSFNVYNCLAAAATSMQAGIELGAIEEGIKALRAVPGRFESVDRGQPFAVIVDYAHTPDSLDNVLRAARDIAQRSSGRVICVFGAGGDRDKAKRPLMGAVAARLADVVIVTSDNPRSEDPHAIVSEILEGVLAESPDGPDHVLVDRKEAITAGIGAAGPGDVVIIAGKGHETGQEFADHKIAFDDRTVAGDVLTQLGMDRP